MFGADSWIRFALTEVYAVCLMAFVCRRQLLEEKRNIWLKILLVMFAMYMANLFYTLLTPTYFFRRFRFSTERLNLIPFRALREWLAHPFNFFGNIFLFLPLGFFEVLFHPAETRKRQLMITVAASVTLSLFVELAQCFNYRVPDADDMILNTLGGVFGALLCMLQQKIGFDRTRVGQVLLPRIPRTWRRHILLNRFCVILVVSMEAILFSVNYFVTVPKADVRTNEALPPEIVSVAEAPAGELPPSPAQEEEAAPATPEPTGAPKVYSTARLELEAENVLLVRLAGPSEKEETVFSVNSSDPVYPASTIKMLVALTVLDIAESDEMVHLGTEVYIPPLDAARAGLEYGMTLTVRSLLKGLLLPSGADAAYALGVYCGRKLAGEDRLSAAAAVQTFLDAANRKGAALGAEHTTLKNVVGLDEKGQLTTAQDILTIAKAFLSQPLLAEICGLPRDLITSLEGKNVSLKNTNKMLLSESPYYNSAVYGMKTGTTSRAGNCLVSVFSVGAENYLCVVMKSSYDGKFRDTQKLFEVCAAE